MNVTAVDATKPGYIQVLPTGVAGDYSNLNTDSCWATIRIWRSCPSAPTAP